MSSVNSNNSNSSKIKTYNILSKTFIVVFVLINFFNFFPFDLTNPQWANSFSLLFIDSFSILLLAIWLMKNSILDSLSLNEANASSKEETEELRSLIDNKKMSLNNLIKISLISLIMICLFQVYVFIRGTNIIDYKLRLNLETIKNEYKLEKANRDYNKKDIQEFIQKANKASFTSASKARSDLLKSILKIIVISSIYGVSIKLLEKA